MEDIDPTEKTANPKPPTGQSEHLQTPAPGKLVTANKWPVLSGAVTIILGLSLLGVYSLRVNSKSNTTARKSPSTRPITSPDVSSLPFPTDTSETYKPPITLPEATPKTTPTPKLFALSLHVLDKSKGDNSGPSVPGTKVKLYQGNKLLGEKTIPTEEPKTGNIGKLAVVTFDVPLGTYKYQAETDTLFGSGEVSLKTFNDQAYYGISLLAKDMHVTGKAFVDTNENGQFDNGEQAIPDLEVTATHTGPASFDYWSAGSTKTDSQGNYNLTIKNYSGNYTIHMRSTLRYRFPSQQFITLEGGQTITGIDLPFRPALGN